MEILDFVNAYWQVLAAIITVILLWARSNQIDKDHEKRLIEIEKEKIETVYRRMEEQRTEYMNEIHGVRRDVQEMNPIFLDIKERLISIETTLKLHISNEDRRV
jgi:predicted membrane protein